MFIALYRWKIKTGSEEDFRRSWRTITVEIYRKCGSFGSRLHQSEDGIWVAYAQWETRDDWERLRNSFVLEDPDARKLWRDSIESAMPEIYMNVTDDLLKNVKFSNET